MFCKQCGAELLPGASFCKNCGFQLPKPIDPTVAVHPATGSEAEQTVNPTEVQAFPAGGVQYPQPAQEPSPVPEQKPQKAPKKKMKKGKKIFITVTAILLVLILAAGGLFLKWYLSPEQKLLRALESENYDEAGDIYRKELGNKSNEDITQALTERIEEVKENYVNKSRDYAATVSELEKIQEMKVKAVQKLLDETVEFVNILNASRTAFSTAESMMENKDYENAITQYKLVQEIDADYNTALDQMQKAVDGYREDILTKAAEQAQQEQYEEAIAQLNIGLTVLPQDAKLEEQIQIYTVASGDKIRADVLVKAKGYADSGDYVAAIKVIKDAQKTQGDDAEYQNALKTYSDDYEAKVIASADNMAEDGDYIGALREINSATEIIGTSEAFNSKKIEYETNYVNESLDSADEFLNIRDIDKAKQVIEDALALFPDNAELIAKSKEIENLKPVSLSTITPFNYDSKYIENIVWNEGVPTDPFGNDYTNCKNYSINKFSPSWLGGSAYAEYNLDGKYDGITGRLSPYSNIEENGSIYFQIYADGQLAYTSPIITRKTEPIEFSVEITGAEYIKIYVQIQNDGGSLIISDVMLWKDSANESNSDTNQTSVLISELSPFNSGSKYIDDIVWNSGFPVDIPGNDYTNCKNYSINKFAPGWLGGNAYIEYRLNGEYKKLSGRISPYADTQENGSIYMQVFADEQLVYTSPDITRKTEMLEFSVDISGAMYIKIVVQIKNSGGSLIMSDVVLWKD